MNDETKDHPQGHASHAGPTAESDLRCRYGDSAVTSLHDFLTFAEEADSLVRAPGRDRFFRDRTLQLSAEALLHKIGESVARLPDQFRSDHAQVPWRAIRGMRNLVAHQYHAVDYSIVWSTVDTALPEATAAIRDILGP